MTILVLWAYGHTLLQEGHGGEGGFETRPYGMAGLCAGITDFLGLSGFRLSPE